MLAVEEELVECNSDLRFLVTTRAQDRCADVLDVDVALVTMMNQDLSNGPEFYENTATEEELDEYERQILEENQRRNQEARGDNVEIPDSTENDGSRSYNPYYTDEDESYIPPEYPSYVRRTSDSSSDANTEKHYDQHEGGFPEDMLRCTHEDLN
ncbi:hypothetical protein G6F43_013104 [Rhizopus delemar]|nr:hypothetical protein G6F43_013104 [Rhizopus delemar]